MACALQSTRGIAQPTDNARVIIRTSNIASAGIGSAYSCQVEVHLLTDMFLRGTGVINWRIYDGSWAAIDIFSRDFDAYKNDFKVQIKNTCNDVLLVLIRWK